MRRVLLGLVAIAMVALSAHAQDFPGPSSPAQARIYFYRGTDTDQVTRWTAAFLNDAKIGNLGERSYFYRDVQPGTYKVGVSSDVPYPDQYHDVTVTPNSTTYIRVYFIQGYGIQFNAGGLNSGPSIYQPSVFGIRVMDPAVAVREMVGLNHVE